MIGSSTRVALLGRGGALPFAGCFRADLEAPDGEARISFAGRVTPGDHPEEAWRVSRVVARALSRKGAPRADRRRALSILWARLDGVRDDLDAHAGDLSLLLLAADPEGIALSGVGLGGVIGVGPGGARPWVEGAHPLLGPPGLPTRRPGAITADGGPPWLVAAAHGETADLGGDLLAQAGVLATAGGRP